MINISVCSNARSISFIFAFHSRSHVFKRILLQTLEMNHPEWIEINIMVIINKNAVKDTRLESKSGLLRDAF